MKLRECANMQICKYATNLTNVIDKGIPILLYHYNTFDDNNRSVSFGFVEKGYQLKRGGIFKHKSVANLPLSLLAKKIWKSVSIWGSYGQEFSVLFF